MNHKVLVVDDEPAVLEGYKRLLRREFDLETAEGGELGLRVIQEQGPFALVISDMRMPRMDGVQFLSRVKELSPETVRMVLTGHADMQAAIDAVNQGSVFRFLTKPCEKETLAKAITTGFVQYQLVIAEKVLLENTLMGCIKVLSEVLGLANPAAFGRSVRITGYVRHMVKKLKLSSPWRFEIAAMLSQLGCISLHPDVIEAAYAGNALSSEDQKRFDQHPLIAKDLLINIPRLEPTAWMIGQQSSTANHDALPPANNSLPKEVLTMGAKMLKIANKFDDLRVKGLPDPKILEQLRFDPSNYDRELVNVLEDLVPAEANMELRSIPVAKLTSGMVLQQEIRTHGGLLLVTKGQEVNHPLLIKLANYVQRRSIDDNVMALVPVSH
jgi:response regulator RpfG family c-di-GMP phosphodiesterase